MAQTTPQSSYISLYLRTKCMAPKTKKKGKIAHEKKGVCDSNHRPSGRWEDLSKNRNRIRCRKTTRARARLPAAESGETSEVRHVEQTPHRMVDLISRKGVHGSKPGLNLTARLLRHGQHIYTYIYYCNLLKTFQPKNCTNTSKYDAVSIHRCNMIEQ